jgi:hypothetical protein
MALQAVELLHSLRSMDLRKSPSISETLDWAKTLVTLNAKNLEAGTVETTLSVLLKHESDLQRARRWLTRPGSNRNNDQGIDPRLSRWRG